MKNIKIMSLTLLLALVVAFLGCQSLSTQNLNNPDEERALATASDVESLIAGTFLTWHQAISWSNPSMALTTTSDVYSCSWGNFGMRFLSSEPRATFNNTTAFSDRAIIETPWFGCYSAISAANDGIRSIQSGLVDLGPDNQRALAFAKFMQGLAHGYLALMFDQAFIFDETVNLETDVLELRPYNEVMSAAIAQLNAAIDISNNNSFVLEESWINGLPLTNDQLAQLAHSFAARYLAGAARNPSDRQAVDWNTVLSHANAGITADFAPMSDGADQWWDAVQWFAPQYGTWQRADYKLIGPSDRSSGYSDWLATPDVLNRDEFEMDTGDLRIWDQTRAADGSQNPGSQFRFTGPSPYPIARGTYHFSRYGHDRYAQFVSSGGETEMMMFRVTENELLKAEALLHTGGDAGQIAGIIDATRVTDGGYPSAAGAAIGSITDTSDPKPGASMWAMYKYEHDLETLGTFSGLQYWNRRGWGDLTTNSALHFPVPAQDLENLLLELYTFGGGGDGSAPKSMIRSASGLLRSKPN